MRKRAVVDAKAFSAALDQVSKALGKSHIPVQNGMAPRTRILSRSRVAFPTV